MDIDSNVLLTRFLLCICQGMLLCQLWDYREHVFHPMKLFCTLKSFFVPEPRAPGTDTRLDKLRIANIRSLFTTLQQVCAVIFASLVFAAERAACAHPLSSDEHYRFQSTVFNALIIYAVGVLFGVKASTQRHIDFLFATASLSYTLRIVLAQDDLWLYASSGRTMIRVILSVFYMKANVSSVINLGQTLCMCWAYSHRPLPSEVYISEMFSWVCITLLCITTEAWFNAFLKREIAADDTNRTLERLLAGFCDCVVPLDSELQIKRATPQLRHVLHGKVVNEQNDLERASFIDLLYTQADKDKFAVVVAASMCRSAASAWRTSLRHNDQPEVPVELFHVCSDDQLTHLIGIRELRKEMVPPDESILQNQQAPSLAHVRREPLEEVTLMQRQGILQGRSLRSLSSSSKSSSSSSKSSRLVKRMLLDLERIDLLFDMSLHLQDYALRFGGAMGAAQPSLKSCFPSQIFENLEPWLDTAVNTILNGEDDVVEYKHSLMFRPPTSACASSKVMLTAEGIKLTQMADDDDEDKCTFCLHLRGISHALKDYGQGSTQSKKLEILAEGEEET